MNSAPVEPWLYDDELVDAAYADIIAEGDVQTAFTTVPPPEPPPEWLLNALAAIARFFSGTGSFFYYLLIALAVLLVLYLLYRMVPGIKERVDGWLGRKREVETEPDWSADAATARELLGEADALAAQGRYAEAAHLLLWRSLEDIARRRPDFLKPALTSRDISRASALPPAPRDAFAAIARTVEVSLFGGRSVDADGWAQCRTAYSALTVPQNWAAT